MGKPRGHRKLPKARYWIPELLDMDVVQIEPLTPLPQFPYIQNVEPGTLASKLIQEPPMKEPKPRKPRTSGQYMDLDGTSHINGRPYRFDTIAECKIHKRLRDGLCPGCGKKPCECKSKS